MVESIDSMGFQRLYVFRLLYLRTRCGPCVRPRSYEYKTLGLHGRSILHKVVPKPV
jgi:hypothetical protein